MKAIRQPDGSLLVRSFPAFCVIFGAILAGTVLWLVLNAEARRESPLALPAVALLGTVLLVYTERSTFHFQPGDQRLNWSKSRLLSRTGGTVPFGGVRDVRIETRWFAGDRTKSYRIVLVTEEGALPMTNSFSGNEQVLDAVRGAIAGVLTQPKEALPEGAFAL